MRKGPVARDELSAISFPYLLPFDAKRSSPRWADGPCR